MNDNNIELLKKAQNGDKEAEQQIVSHNLGLVWSVVKKFSNRGYEMEDLYQIGCIGIINAIKKFDLSFDVRFSTYAVPMIMGEIKRFMRDDGIIKVSRNLKEVAMKARVTKGILSNELLREPTVSEIAERINVNIDELIMALDASAAPESLYKTIYDDTSSQVFLMDRMESLDSENKVIDKIVLDTAIKDLPKRDRQIIILRYFRGKTQSEISKMLGISQVQVSRLEKKILESMRQKVKEA